MNIIIQIRDQQTACYFIAYKENCCPIGYEHLRQLKNTYTYIVTF